MSLLKDILGEEMIPSEKGNIPGPKMRERATVEAGVKNTAGSLNKALAAGDWQRAESLLGHMLSQVKKLTAGEPSRAPSLEKPSIKV